jgi:hypothetical protein
MSESTLVSNMKTSTGYEEYFVAIASISVLYTGIFTGFDLILPAISMISIFIIIFRDINIFQSFIAKSPIIIFALFCYFLVLINYAASTIIANHYIGISRNDFALFLIQTILPIMIILCPRRERIILAFCKVSVIFALSDAIVNLLALNGFVDIVLSGRVVGDISNVRYAGLTGSTHAAGFIGFIAICYLFWLVRNSNIRLLWFFVISPLLLFSQYLIDARRYQVFLIVAVSLLWTWRYVRKFGLHMVSLSIATILLIIVFSVSDYDYGNILRGKLLLNGFERALSGPILGTGPYYFDFYGAVPTFESLSAIGVTESYLIDLSISYGIVSSALFLFFCLVVLRAQSQGELTLPAIFLCTMTSELFVGGALRGFSGAILYFCCLFACLAPSLKSAHVRTKAANSVPLKR